MVSFCLTEGGSLIENHVNAHPYSRKFSRQLNFAIFNAGYFMTLNFHDFEEFATFFFASLNSIFVESRKTRMIGVAKISFNKV